MTEVPLAHPPKYPPPWIVGVLVLTFVTVYVLFFGVGQDIWDAISHHRCFRHSDFPLSLLVSSVFATKPICRCLASPAWSSMVG